MKYPPLYLLYFIRQVSLTLPLSRSSPLPVTQPSKCTHCTTKGLLSPPSIFLLRFVSSCGSFPSFCQSVLEVICVLQLRIRRSRGTVITYIKPCCFLRALTDVSRNLMHNSLIVKTLPFLAPPTPRKVSHRVAPTISQWFFPWNFASIAIILPLSLKPAFSSIAFRDRL